MVPDDGLEPTKSQGLRDLQSLAIATMRIRHCKLEKGLCFRKPEEPITEDIDARSIE